MVHLYPIMDQYHTRYQSDQSMTLHNKRIGYSLITSGISIAFSPSIVAYGLDKFGQFFGSKLLTPYEIYMISWVAVFLSFYCKEKYNPTCPMVDYIILQPDFFFSTYASRWAWRSSAASSPHDKWNGHIICWYCGLPLRCLFLFFS